MPAVTADTLTLPHIKHPELAELNSHTYRPVSTITTAPSGYEGDGFPVRRAFTGVPKSVLDPFVHMDQMGEVEYLPNEARGTDWHPTAASKPSPTLSTANSNTRTPTVEAATLKTATPSG